MHGGGTVSSWGSFSEHLEVGLWWRRMVVNLWKEDLPGVFFWGGGKTNGMQSFLGQVLNQSHSHDNTRSLTH